jgi:hypothetical protein
VFVAMQTVVHASRGRSHAVGINFDFSLSGRCRA